jgi:dipeptidase
VPWYLGITESPEVYRNSKDRYNPDSAWWRFKLLGMLANMNYKECIEAIKPVWAEEEKNMLESQNSVEKTVLELFEKAPIQAREYLTDYSSGRAMNAYEKAGSLRNECIRLNAIAGK